MLYLVESENEPAEYELAGEKYSTFKDATITVPANPEYLESRADALALKWWQVHGKEATDGEAYKALVRVMREACEKANTKR